MQTAHLSLSLLEFIFQYILKIYTEAEGKRIDTEIGNIWML